jgi:hypothetical protein
MPEVFISSSKQASGLARRLAEDLQSEGFSTFVPVLDIQPDAAPYPQIVRQASQSDAFLVLVESNPKRSPALEQQWFAVLNEASGYKKGKKLIPLVVGPGKAPNFLRNWEALHVPKPDDSKRWSKMVSRISDALRSKAKPKLKPFSKADLLERKRRMDEITAAADYFESLQEKAKHITDSLPRKRQPDPAVAANYIKSPSA